MIFLYRINGGEVLGVSVDMGAYAGIDAAFYAAIADPPTPDGIDLSVPKIYDGTNLRNASPSEITNFTSARNTDQVLSDRNGAKAWVNTLPVNKKALQGIASVLLDEFNLHADKINSILSAVDAASSLNDLKSRVALIADYPQRTMSQVLNAVDSKIDSGAVD